ncbi:uncharacterized protein METZ01_LOCUS88493, partial [marine metagenome]
VSGHLLRWLDAEHAEHRWGYVPEGSIPQEHAGLGIWTDEDHWHGDGGVSCV